MRLHIPKYFIVKYVFRVFILRTPLTVNVETSLNKRLLRGGGVGGKAQPPQTKQLKTNRFNRRHRWNCASFIRNNFKPPPPFSTNLHLCLLEISDCKSFRSVSQEITLETNVEEKFSDKKMLFFCPLSKNTYVLNI